MQRGWSIAVVTWFVGLIPSVCVAAPPAESMAAEPDVRGANEARRWYGWQIFTADLTAGALFLGAVADDHNSALFGLSGFSFGLGGPTIHAAHGRWDVALGSLGLRVLGPVVGAVIGVQADTPNGVAAAAAGAPARPWARILRPILSSTTKRTKPRLSPATAQGAALRLTPKAREAQGKISRSV